MTGKRPQSASRQRIRRIVSSPSEANSKHRSRRPLTALAVLLILLIGMFFYVGGLPRLSNHFAEAAIGRRDLPAAKAWLEVTERISPRNSARFFLAARIARKEGDLQQMTEDLDRALHHGFDPERIRREHLLGLAQTGRLEGIEAEINQWLMAGDSETPEISDAYANGLAIEARLDSAMRVLRAWHHDYPDDPVPLYRKGRIQEYFDQIADAKKNYRASIALDSEYLPPYYSLGRLLLDDRQPEEAMVFFQRCLAVPHPAAARVGIARCLIELGETQKAAELLASVVELDSKSILASYRVFGETPERFVAAAELGRLEANAENYQEAVRLLDLAIAENPRDLAARYSRAVALRGLGRQEEAKAEFQRVQTIQQALEQVNGLRNRIGRNPEDTEARIALGKLLLVHESERSGMFWLRSVLVYDPGNVQVHQELADYYESHAANSSRHARLAREHRQYAAAIKAD